MLGITSKLSFYVGILFIPYLKLTAKAPENRCKRKTTSLPFAAPPRGDLLVLPLGLLFWGCETATIPGFQARGFHVCFTFRNHFDIWMVHGGSKTRGTSKWMVYNGTPYEMDDFRVPRFLETLHIDLVTMTQIFRFRSLLWMRGWTSYSVLFFSGYQT